MTVGQILVTVLLIYILLRKPETRAEMGRALQNSDKRWFLAGLGAYGAVVLLGSVRWHILLRVQKIRIGYSRVLQLFMIGSFFNPFLPSTVGGDVVKGYYLLRETSEPKPTAPLTILMDRIIGLVALIVLSAARPGATATTKGSGQGTATTKGRGKRNWGKRADGGAAPLTSDLCPLPSSLGRCSCPPLTLVVAVALL